MWIEITNHKKESRLINLRYITSFSAGENNVSSDKSVPCIRFDLGKLYYEWSFDCEKERNREYEALKLWVIDQDRVTSFKVR